MREWTSQVPLLTPDFGTEENLIKMDLNEEVLHVKKFCGVDMNIFEVRAIAVRSHLEGRNCVRSAEISYSEYCSSN